MPVPEDLLKAATTFDAGRATPCFFIIDGSPGNASSYDGGAMPMIDLMGLSYQYSFIITSNCECSF
jgi:hypothetical protein